MNKIPVWRTISQTYGFAISRYFPILGAIWLPFLLMGLVGYFVMMPAVLHTSQIMQQYTLRTIADSAPHPLPPELAQYTGQMYLSYFLFFVLFTVISVGLSKEALGLRRGPRFVYLSIGKAELLVAAAYFVAFAMFLIAVFVAAIPIGIVAVVVAMSHGASATTSADAIQLSRAVTRTVVPAMLVVELVLFYFFLRLTYFVAPVSIVEKRFGLWRSWSLSRGNSWRMVGVVLGTMLPLFVIEFAVIGVLWPSYFTWMHDSIANPLSPANSQRSVEFMQVMAKYFVPGWIVGFLLTPIAYGIMLGQTAFAYRALAPESQNA